MSEPSDSNAGNDSDLDFDPSAEMMVNDFDDEHTLDEEEALNEEDSKEEIDELTKEGNMPIEELLAMYGYKEDAEKSSDSASNSNQSTSQPPSASTSASTATAAGTAAGPSSTRTATAAAAASTYMSDYSDSDSDEDFSANEDEWRRVIQVGSDYQAVIPDGLSHYAEEEDEEKEKEKVNTRHQGENQDILLWKPLDDMDDEALDDYVRQYDSMFDEELAADHLPNGDHNRDDDHALYLLFKCQYNIAEALRQYELNPNPPAEASPVRKMMDPWTEEECRAFESGLRMYGKDFFTIKNSKISSRTVGEVITFYYFWKKTERHDQFVAKFRIEKKKYALHPGTTDYMDRFLDEQENMTQSVMNALPNSGLGGLSGSSSSHNSNSLLHSAGSNAASNYHLNPNRQSSSGYGINHAQARSSHHSSSSSAASSYASHGADSLVTISGNNMRTINVSGSGETQTILINEGDFNGSASSARDKPIVVLAGSSGSGSGSSSSSAAKSSYYNATHHHHPSRHSNASASSTTSASVAADSSSHATIVVGKNPVVIDGDWVNAGSGNQPSSSSPTRLSTPSVSIYKIPSNPSSGFNR